MKFLRIPLVIFLLLTLAVFIVSNVFTITGTAPMIAIPVVITKDGKQITPDSLISFKFAFSEKANRELKLSTPTALKDAHWLQEYFLVQAPFTIIYGSLFSREKISPEYRYLFLMLSFKDGKNLSLSLPVLSDTRLNSPLYLDISEK